MGRRWVTTALLLGLFGTAPASAAPPPPELLMGMAELQRNRPRMAVEKFLKVLREHPDEHRGRLGLVRAFDQLGRCDRIMEHVPALEVTRFWMPDAMIAQADCEVDVGAYAIARSLYQQAIDRQTESPQPPLRLARLCITLGDLSCVGDALDELLVRERGPAWAAVVEAELSVAMAAPSADGQLVALGLYGFVPEVSMESARLQVLRLLDVGDPSTAAERSVELVAANVSSQVYAAIRAEALRRSGYPIDALAAFSRPALRTRADSVQMGAVRARILTDLGELSEARLVLTGLPAGDPEVVASWWYLARARADEAGIEAWHARWAAHHVYGGRPLELLIPLAENAP